VKNLLGIFLIVALVSPAAFSEPKGKDGVRGRGLERMLNLTAEQKKAVTEIRGKHRPKLRELRSKAREMKKELVSSVQTPTKGDAYQKSLLEKFNAFQSVKQELSAARFQMALEIRETLKDDQIRKFKEIGPSFRRHHKGESEEKPDEDSGV